MTTYNLTMRDSQTNDTKVIEADTLEDAREQADAETEAWIEDGEWGSDGASIGAWWTLSDEDGDEIDTGSVTVDIEPDHDALISAAGGDTDCDHDWSAEGEGGLSENPGVWSTGGTAMVFHAHCRSCGLHRKERSTGSQRNPGEHDTVEYEQPANWCVECQREECECEADA